MKSFEKRQQERIERHHQARKAKRLALSKSGDRARGKSRRDDGFGPGLWQLFGLHGISGMRTAAPPVGLMSHAIQRSKNKGA